jgi:subtilisin
MAKKKPVRKLSRKARSTRQTTRRYVLLPPQGITAASAPASQTSAPFFLSLGVAKNTTVAPNVKMHVVDAIAENGAKLVEMSESAALKLSTSQPGLRIVPEMFYERALYRPAVVSKAKPSASGASTKIAIKVTASATGKPVAGVHVVAFTDFSIREGAEVNTNASGKASLALGAAKKKIERLYLYPGPNLWPMLHENITITTGSAFALHAIDLGFKDCVRHFYGNAADVVGAGVTVGIIDAGVALNHSELTVSGGLNTVPGEASNNFGDGGGEHHGSHVAGIVAATGTPPQGIRGVAPGVKLMSYRVFPATPPGGKGAGASNFSIAKAIHAAINDGCDLINMSLGVKSGSHGQPDDEVVRSAISDARAAGALVLVAAGNDGRKPVAFPASDPRAVAVSALGRSGTFLPDSDTVADVMPPPGSDSKNFIAAFSNIGDAVNLTGPGAAVISTVPGGHAIMSGTSMACPAVTGACARLLAADDATRNMPRDQARSDAIAKLAFKGAKSLGFPIDLEGHGLVKT